MRCVFNEIKRESINIPQVKLDHRGNGRPEEPSAYTVEATDMTIVVTTQCYFDAEFEASRTSVEPVMVIHHTINVLGDHRTWSVEGLVDGLIDETNLSYLQFRNYRFDLVDFCKSESSAIRSAIASADDLIDVAHEVLQTAFLKENSALIAAAIARYDYNRSLDAY